MTRKIGFGGSCHWCTEAIFASLLGVEEVEQGWIASDGEHQSFSEAVLVTYDPEIIGLAVLIEIHLYTHSCTSIHQMRAKYRSAVYLLDAADQPVVEATFRTLQQNYTAPIITLVLAVVTFRLNTENYLNYYYSNPDKPFCENIVNPKLKLLLAQFASRVNQEKLKSLKPN